MKDLSDLIDVTRFQTVLNHLKNNPEIEMIVNVGNEDLAYVAGIMECGDVKAFEALYKAGKISGDHVPSTNAVDVIMLPPAYVFKDRGVRYS